MAGYIGRRLVAALLVVILTSMFVFALFFLGPSDPAAPICNANGRCTPERLELIRHAMGFDQSVVVQYAEFVKGLFVDRTINMGAKFHCDAPCLGISYGSRGQVTHEMVHLYPATLTLAIGGSAIYLILGIVLGSLAARFRGTLVDRVLVGSSLVISSIPYYLLALVAWVFLYLKWNVFPETRYYPITKNPALTFAGMLLPWLILGLVNSTQYARFTRGSMVDSLGEDYIRTAVAKGVRSNKVIFKHGLRAAIVPVITLFGLDFAGLLAGTIFTEYIFGIDGVGNWSLSAIRSPIDFPVVNATVLVTAVLVVTANLIVDIVYSFIDPRVRLT